MPATPLYSVVFDFGGVLLDWDPWYLYQKVFSSREEYDRFITESKFYDWIARSDRGVKFNDLFEEIGTITPQWVAPARLFTKRFLETIRMCPKSIDILKDLYDLGTPLFGLTNWSSETFPLVRKKYTFFEFFRGIIVSGEEGIKKPNPDFFKMALSRWQLTASSAVFIDDKEENVEAAQSVGICSILFKTPEQLRKELKTLKIPFE